MDSYFQYKITKRISPGEFLKILNDNPNTILNSRIIAPKLGSNSLGEIEIEYKKATNLLIK